jgi:ParB family chromosome partitioning protein
MRHLKKGEMAEQAEQLLSRSGWLPEPLRTVGVETITAPVVETPAVDGADQTSAASAEDGEGAEVQDPKAETNIAGELPAASLSYPETQGIAAE